MFSKEKRQLKKDVKDYQEQVLEYQRKISDLNIGITTLQKDNKGKHATIAKLEAERDKLKGIVREQTDADLLVNAFKAVGIIKEEKKTDYQAEENRLMVLRGSAGLTQEQSPLQRQKSLHEQLLGVRLF